MWLPSSCTRLPDKACVCRSWENCLRDVHTLHLVPSGLWDGRGGLALPPPSVKVRQASQPLTWLVGTPSGSGPHDGDPPLPTHSVTLLTSVKISLCALYPVDLRKEAYVAFPLFPVPLFDLGLKSVTIWWM